MPFDVIGFRQELPAPSICVLCEKSRHGSEKDFFVSGVGELNDARLGFGRKLVCESCATDLGLLMGMEKSDDVEAARGAADAAVSSLKSFRQRVSDVAGELVDVAAHEPVPEIPPVPSRKRKLFGRD